VKRLARRHGLDVLIVVAAVAAVAEALAHSDDANAYAAPPVVAAAACLVMVLPLLGRRRSPFLAPAWLWLFATPLSFLDGRLVVTATSVYAAGMVSAFLLGSLPNERQGRIGLVIVVAGAAIIAFNDPAHSLSELVVVPTTFSLAWLGGFAHRERAAQARLAEERARQAEHDREMAARIAVAEERARIARELHDIVAHAVSVMVLQVGAVRHRLPDELATDVEALRGVEETGRSALGDMRRLLGVMRRGAEVPELAPQPGLERLDVRPTCPRIASCRRGSRTPSSTRTPAGRTSACATPPASSASRSPTTVTARRTSRATAPGMA
jgi:signal transduction histidine kinase